MEAWLAILLTNVLMAALNITIIVLFFKLCQNVNNITRRLNTDNVDELYKEAAIWAKAGNSEKAKELYLLWMSARIRFEVSHPSGDSTRLAGKLNDG